MEVATIRSSSASTFSLIVKGTDLAFIKRGVLFCLKYSFAVVIFNVPKPGLKSSANSWFKSVHSIWLQVAEILISNFSSQSLPRRFGPDLGATSTLKSYILPWYLTFMLATPFGIMTPPE